MHKHQAQMDSPLPQDYFVRKFGTSRVTIWRYRRAGLPAIVVGSKIFIRESDFVSFLVGMNGRTATGVSDQKGTR